MGGNDGRTQYYPGRCGKNLKCIQQAYFWHRCSCGCRCNVYWDSMWTIYTNHLVDKSKLVQCCKFKYRCFRSFQRGTFTSPINGWYHICSFSRFKQGGNSNDVTVFVSGGIVAAYGSGITEDWLTTGVCFDAYLALNTQVQVRHQSGGSQDCIEYATWPHNKFTVHTIGNGNP